MEKMEYISLYGERDIQGKSYRIMGSDLEMADFQYDLYRAEDPFVVMKYYVLLTRDDLAEIQYEVDDYAQAQICFKRAEAELENEFYVQACRITQGKFPISEKFIDR